MEDLGSSSRTSLTSSPPITPQSQSGRPSTDVHVKPYATQSGRPSTDLNVKPYTIVNTTPRAYLPLRKASAEALRRAAGESGLRDGHVNTRRMTGGEQLDGRHVKSGPMIEEEEEENTGGVILPTTTYTPPSKQQAAAQAGLAVPTQQAVARRSRSFSEDPKLSKQSPRQKILRAATSIPDYKTIRNAYRRTAAQPPSTPPSPQVHRIVSGGVKSRQSPRSPSIQHEGDVNGRASIRSAFTNGSSTAQDWSETDRSSVWTDASRASQFVPNVPNWPIKEEEMSVEDAIDMYGDDSEQEGREDAQQAPIPVPDRAISPPQSSVIPQTSPRLDVTSSPPPPISSSFSRPQTRGSVSAPQPHIRASSHVASGHIDHITPNEDSTSRLKALISVPRDRYGFKKQSKDISLAQYDAWNASYTKYLERRRKKWIALMKHHNLPTENPTRFPPRSDKVKRYIRKGIPPDWRGAAWWWYAGGPAVLRKQAGVYDILLKRAETGHLSEGDREHIERDLHRTYPDNIHFKPDTAPAFTISSSSRPTTSANTSEPPASNTPASSPPPPPNTPPSTPHITSLRNVLSAFALYNPKIGYCQSLNFLAGTLLLFLQNDEERAFHLLCILTSVHLPGTHGVALEGANVDIGVLMQLLRDAMPSLWGKIDDRADTTVALAAGDMRVSTGLPTVSLATTAWFMSCYSASLPPETTARVWDALFYEGSKTLFRVGLAIFKLSEAEIRRTTDPMEAFAVVQSAPRRMLDASRVMDVAVGKRRGGAFVGLGLGRGGEGKDGFGGVSGKVVEGRREERRGIYRVEKERVLKGVEAVDANGAGGEGNGGRDAETTSTSSTPKTNEVRKMPSKGRLARLKSLRSPSKQGSFS